MPMNIAEMADIREQELKQEKKITMQEINMNNIDVIEAL